MLYKCSILYKKGGEGDGVIFDFGKHLQDTRQKAGYSQSQVHKLLGISKGSMSAYERNINAPSIENVKRLAKLYKVSVDYLVGADLERRISVEGISEQAEQAINLLINDLRKQNKK